MHGVGDVLRTLRSEVGIVERQFAVGECAPATIAVSGCIDVSRCRDQPIDHMYRAGDAVVHISALPIGSADQVEPYGIAARLRENMGHLLARCECPVAQVPMCLHGFEAGKVGMLRIEYHRCTRSDAIRRMDVGLFLVQHLQLVAHLVEVDALAERVDQVQLHGIDAIVAVAMVGGQTARGVPIAEVPFVA